MMPVTLSAARSVVLSIFSINQQSAEITHFMTFCKKNSVPVVYLENESVAEGNLLALKAKLETLRPRSCLLVCGELLETSVTTCILNALVWGYDTYLVGDLVHVGDPSHKELAIDRLLQAGVVPVTTEQVRYEWLTNAPPNCI
jgi:nicotinamidase-related amidase